MSKYQLDARNIEILQNTIKEYQEGAEKKITNYLHGTGYTVLSDEIQSAIPISSSLKKHGKSQPKGHARSAEALQDRVKNSNLAVTIGTKSKYNYLYFPDDGSNTVHHAGNQQFFSKAADRKQDKIVEDLVEVIKFE